MWILAAIFHKGMYQDKFLLCSSLVYQLLHHGETRVGEGGNYKLGRKCTHSRVNPQRHFGTGWYSRSLPSSDTCHRSPKTDFENEKYIIILYLFCTILYTESVHHSPLRFRQFKFGGLVTCSPAKCSFNIKTGS